MLLNYPNPVDFCVSLQSILTLVVLFSEMGAEQSSLDKRGSRSPTTVQEYAKETWKGEKWLKDLPQEMREYLNCKREEFEQVEKERNDLRNELMANKMSYQCIIDGYIDQVTSLEKSNEGQLAKLVSLQAISEGLISYQSSYPEGSSSSSTAAKNRMH